MLNTRINSITAHEVIVPARTGYVDRPEFGDSIFDKTSKWIIEVQTDSGLTGIGETERGCDGESVRRGAEQIIGKRLADLNRREPLLPDWEGHDMYGHPSPPVPPRLDECEWPASPAMTAFRIAIHDLWGKAMGVPVHALFPERKCRDEVKVSWWFGRSDPEHAAQQMQIGLEQGFTSVKFKAAAEDDVPGIVRAIRSVAGPETQIIIDPNERFYRLSETLAIVRKLEEFENIILEDPFPFRAEEWSLLRQKTTLPLAVHGHSGAALLYGPERPFDFVNIGGADFLFLAELAWHYQMRCWYGSGLELGILDTWILHQSAVARACTLPNDVGHHIREDDLIVETLEVQNGQIRVPNAPGLGVTLDQDALKHYSINTFTVGVAERG